MYQCLQLFIPWYNRRCFKHPYNALMSKNFLIVSVSFFIFLLPVLAYSQTPSPSQSAGAQQAQQEQEQSQQRLERQIEAKKKELEAAPLTQKPISGEEGQKYFVREIDVQGVTLIPKSVVDDIAVDYEQKELSINDMQ